MTSDSNTHLLGGFVHGEPVCSELCWCKGSDDGIEVCPECGIIEFEGCQCGLVEDEEE